MTFAHDFDFKITEQKFTKILVAIDEDDSKSSIAAFEYAVTQAKALAVPLGITSIMEINELNIFEKMTKDTLQARRNELAQNIELYVQKAKEYGVKEVTGLMGEGKPGEVIISSIVPKFKPDLLVCGSKTHLEQKKFFMGVESTYLAQNAPCSVMVIRPN